ncbi:MAG: PAS domain-containing protein, partial [Verrucomicrobia bacterium]|nr:PAS domain-containing protein [Verrucomicrobiota bacterium]
MDSSDPLQRGLRWLALFCAGFPVIAGIISCIGWSALGWSEPPLAPGTALGLATLGAAVAALLLAPGSRMTSFAACLAAVILLTWSAVRLTSLTDALPAYAKVSPLTALSFALASCAVLLLAGHSPIRSRINDLIAGSLGIIVLGIALGFSLNLYSRPPLRRNHPETAGSSDRGGGAPVFTRSPVPALSFDLLGLALCLTAALRDVMERRGSRRRIFAQRAATQVLVESATLAEAGPLLLAAVCENLRWHFGTVWMRREDTRVLRCLATWRAPELGATAAELETLCRQLPLDKGCDLPGIVWSSGQPEWLADAAAAGANDKTKFPRAEAFARAGLRRACAVPILHEKKTLGVVEILHQETRPPDAELLDTLRAVTSQLALFITRKQFEESLSRERNLLRAVIDNLPDHIYLKDTAGHYVVDNAAHTRFLGQTSADNVIGKTVFDFFAPELAESFTEDDQLVLSSNRAIINREEPISGADGSKGWVATSKLPFHDNEGNIIGLVCVSRDISAQ